jgi:hypothetical protein
MKTNGGIVQPFLRLLLAAGALGLSFVLNDATRLLALWVLLFIGPGFAARVVKIHLIFLLYACLPIFIGSLLIHAANYGNVRALWHLPFPTGIVEPATLATVRIAIVGLVIQVFFVRLLQQALLTRLLQHYGLRGRALMLVAGSIALVEDIRVRIGRVSDSYKARGLMPQGRLMQALRAGQYLRPLFVSVLATAITRGDAWQNREMLGRLECWEDVPINFAPGVGC